MIVHFIYKNYFIELSFLPFAVPDLIRTDYGGHIVYDVAGPQSNSADVISLRFRTTNANGIIFYARTNGAFSDYMLLEVRRGELYLKIDLGK